MNSDFKIPYAILKAQLMERMIKYFERRTKNWFKRHGRGQGLAKFIVQLTSDM